VRNISRYIKPVRQSPVWLAIFADMTTNLMLFFLMLFVFQHQRFAGKEAPRIEIVRAGKLMEQSAVEELRNKFTTENVGMEVKKGEIRILLGTEILFESGSAMLKSGAKELLAKIAPRLMDLDNIIIIEGHTDNVPLLKGGDYNSNWELSAVRAGNVEKYLHEYAVAANFSKNDTEKFLSRLRIACYGEYRPIAPNNTAQGRARNRRIEIAIKRLGV